MPKDTRPKNLNFFTIRFPIPAIISILHRISGVILFLSIPLLLWALNDSLTSEANFESRYQMMTSPWVKLIAWGVLSALIFHLVAGIRHLFMDMHVGESLRGGRLMAQLALVISIVFIALIGIWLW